MGRYKKTPLPQCDWHTIVWFVNTREMPRLLKTATPTHLGKDNDDLYSELWTLHKKMCPLPFSHEPGVQLGECPKCQTPIFSAGTELVGPTLDVRPRENVRMPKDIQPEDNPNIQPNHHSQHHNPTPTVNQVNATLYCPEGYHLRTQEYHPFTLMESGHIDIYPSVDEPEDTKTYPFTQEQTPQNITTPEPKPGPDKGRFNIQTPPILNTEPEPDTTSHN